MIKLSQEKYALAVHYIHHYARPIDRALFEYHFNSGSSLEVMQQLQFYQNEDGGVGHGLEPDIRSKFSSPIVSTVALQYAREVKASWEHPFIQSVMKYFTDTYYSFETWPLKLSHMNEFPHADWWKHSEDVTSFQANPGVEIVGYYHAYPQAIPEQLFHIFQESVFQHLDNQHKTPEYHEVLCYLRLVEEMPDPGKTMIVEYLRDSIRDIATLDHTQWGGYCAKPLSLAPSPNAAMFNALEDVIQKNLDYEINNQKEDGSWEPFWEWGQYKDEWETRVKQEWKGYLTVQMLKTLKNYERIE
ncbi:hypothetical protein [Evansella cellulosilytica]|uniref:Uncharacterized protein n=1 Tax=Evansella cellulosilytica (strain ATCC 21833 / DSM 2522 / FERM P-1141 / JCM 9156 / N-4) TaxID=649639 RepID=E6TWP1_EVAC2|nr:hypothetical protein [Evansella cellulosilytica]ADU28724.1 hypothetical protein Bcell_0442 [Evansella cellulosilytica DSM 2522]